jgi:hypothetical protein
MDQPYRSTDDYVPAIYLQLIEQICDDFDKARADGKRPCIEDDLSRVPDTARS